jgi:putative ABC transport system substrate-binding protein
MADDEVGQIIEQHGARIGCSPPDRQRPHSGTSSGRPARSSTLTPDPRLPHHPGMDRRRFLLTSLAGALAVPLAAEAEQAEKVYRIGYLGNASALAQAKRVESLRASLRDLGYVEGKNIVIEFRWADGRLDRLPDLAAELVRLKVDVLLTAGTPGALAAKRATTTIPIVMVGVGDAVGSGVVASLARPGGNITGSTDSVPDLMAKLLELLKEIMPRIRRVAVLVNPDNLQIGAATFKAMESTAGSLKIELERFEARGPSEFESAFSRMAKSRVDAIVVPSDVVFNYNVAAVADLAAKKRLPSAGVQTFAEAGGLLGYGLNFPDMDRHAAYFVDKILKGAKPADLPVEQRTKFELVINLKTAKALGLTIPPSLLARAHQVIE